MISDKVENSERKIKDVVDKATEAKQIAEEAVESGQQTLRQARESVKSAWNQAKSSGLEWGNKLAESSEEGFNAVQSYVRKHPVQSVAVAIAAGILVGSLIASRSSSTEE